MDQLKSRLTQGFHESHFAASFTKLQATAKILHSGKSLSLEERERLENQGNTCEDWSRIRIGGHFDFKRVQHNFFMGDVLLQGLRGDINGPNGLHLPAGLSFCRVQNCVIGNAALHRIDLLSRQVIEDGVFILGAGTLHCDLATDFGQTLPLHPGSEMKTRTLWLWDGMTLDYCEEVLRLSPKKQIDLQIFIKNLFIGLRADFGFIGAQAKMLSIGNLYNTWIGAGSELIKTSAIKNSILLSSQEEPVHVGENVLIEESILQYGCKAESGAIISRSALLEYSSVELHGKVAHSVIGPNTHIAKGEVQASLLGPFVGFHHQSLLISALWPEGKGNVGYGANIGSNHTGKKPDQEIRPGEGNFFGLGCSVKFPANFSEAPYSLFATGITLLPQRLGFPFSLINQPIEPQSGLSSALNEIHPGWVWSQNAYALFRSGYKFEDRNCARRHNFTCAYAFLAPSILIWVLQAYTNLKPAKIKALYLEADIPGLGKNFLTENGRKLALEAYEDFLIFALMHISIRESDKSWLEKIQQALGVTQLNEFLAQQKNRLNQLLDKVLLSLQREDKRGKGIFEDYAEFAIKPSEDSTFQRMKKDMQALRDALA